MSPNGGHTISPQQGFSKHGVVDGGPRHGGADPCKQRVSLHAGDLFSACVFCAISPCDVPARPVLAEDGKQAAPANLLGLSTRPVSAAVDARSASVAHFQFETACVASAGRQLHYKRGLGTPCVSDRLFDPGAVAGGAQVDKDYVDSALAMMKMLQGSLNSLDDTELVRLSGVCSRSASAQLPDCRSWNPVHNSCKRTNRCAFCMFNRLACPQGGG